MVFRNDFVVSLKTNGKILREFKDQVRLPFGSEYSILLKNLRTVDAVADITIDGKDVLNGDQLIVPANQTVELERFLSGDNGTGFRFKFIEKTQEVSEHRGDYIDDGILRVAYTFAEQQVPTKVTKVIHEHHYHNRFIGHVHTDPWVNPYPFAPIVTYCSNTDDSPVMGSSNSIRGVSGSSSMLAHDSLIGGCVVGEDKDFIPPVHPDVSAYHTLLRSASVEPANEAGITAKGSVSNQRFTNGNIGKLETQTNVITLKLVGGIDNKPIEKPILVKTKVTCENCGRKCKAHLSYCPGCGTNVSSFA